jgi:uncharacterized protein (TIGR03643 family)
MMLSDADQSRVIEMAWEDHTPFEAILHLYGLSESQVIVLMRQSLKPSSFRLWRERVTGRSSKHQALRQDRPAIGHQSDDGDQVETDQRERDQPKRHEPPKAYAVGQYKINHGRK